MAFKCDFLNNVKKKKNPLILTIVEIEHSDGS